MNEMNKEEIIGMLSTTVKEGNVEEARTLTEKGIEAVYDHVHEIHIYMKSISSLVR